MKKRESYWRRFEKTGDIRDYLNYTACTREDAERGFEAAEAADFSGEVCAEARIGEASLTAKTEM